MVEFEHEVIDRLGRIETKLDNDYRAIHGNGKPGLLDDVRELQSRVQALEDHHKESEKNHSKLWVIVSILLNIVTSAFSAFFKDK